MEMFHKWDEKSSAMYLVCVGHLHRCDGVASIHGTLECVLIHHSQNIRKRRTIHQGGGTGHEVLSVVRGGSQDVSVLAGDLSDDSGDVFGQGVNQSIVLSNKNLSNASYTCSILGDSIKALAEDQHGDLDKVAVRIDSGKFVPSKNVNY